MAVAPVGPVASTVMSSGKEITGAVVSTTSTRNVLYAGFPALSPAQHSTMVEPSGNRDPDSASQLTGRGPSTASTAEVV